MFKNIILRVLRVDSGSHVLYLLYMHICVMGQVCENLPCRIRHIYTYVRLYVRRYPSPPPPRHESIKSITEVDKNDYLKVSVVCVFFFPFPLHRSNIFRTQLVEDKLTVITSRVCEFFFHFFFFFFEFGEKKLGYLSTRHPMAFGYNICIEVQIICFLESIPEGKKTQIFISCCSSKMRKCESTAKIRNRFCSGRDWAGRVSPLN